LGIQLNTLALKWARPCLRRLAALLVIKVMVDVRCEDSPTQTNEIGEKLVIPGGYSLSLREKWEEQWLVWASKPAAGAIKTSWLRYRE
jgi:hypothetical protein